MSKKIEIAKITIKIGDKEAEITLEQARELKQVLADMLGDGEVKIIREPYPVYPHWQWYPQPAIRNPYSVPYDPSITVTYQASDTSNYVLELKQ